MEDPSDSKSSLTDDSDSTSTTTSTQSYYSQLMVLGTVIFCVVVADFQLSNDSGNGSKGLINSFDNLRDENSKLVKATEVLKDENSKLVKVGKVLNNNFISLKEDNSKLENAIEALTNDVNKLKVESQTSNINSEMVKEKIDLKWEKFVDDISQNALISGHEADDKMNWYCCRAGYNGFLTPGRFNRKLKTCFITWEKMEIELNSNDYMIEILATSSSSSWFHNSFQWITTDGHPIPPRAVQFGMDDDDEALYICRANFGKFLVPGKVVKSDGSCYISLNGKVYKFKKYEILIATT